MDSEVKKTLLQRDCYMNPIMYLISPFQVYFSTVSQRIFP